VKSPSPHNSTTYQPRLNDQSVHHAVARVRLPIYAGVN
jgi:hypothetical protein